MLEVRGQPRVETLVAALDEMEGVLEVSTADLAYSSD